MVTPEEEWIAAALRSRSTYWRESGLENLPSNHWEQASQTSKESWIAVALQARNLWEGIPR